MRSRCRLRRAGVCGSNVQFQEAEPVVSSVKERIELVWGDTLDRGGCLLGVEILCGLIKRLGGAIGWEESSRELCMRIRRMSRKAVVLAVYAERTMMY